jgi:PAS domain S-box-containing protein
MEELDRPDGYFKNTLDHLLEGCQIVDFDWRYRYVNTAAVQHAGALQTIGELLGRRMTDVYPGIDETPLFQTLTRCMTTRSPVRLVNELTHADGSSAWFELSIEPVPEGLLILSLDISERIQAEQALREREERHRALVDAARYVIFTLAPDGTFTSLNPSFETFTGWTRAEWLGHSFEELIAEEDRPSALDQFTRVLHGETLRAVRLRVQTRAGERLIVELNLSSQIKDSRTIGLLGIARDMTEEQHVADALAASERRFRALVENSLDSIAVLDAQGQITYVSPTAGRSLGIPLNDLIGRSTFHDLHPDDEAAVRNFLAEVVAHPGAARTVTARYRDRAGGWHWFEAIAQNLLAEPAVRGIVVNYRDITARKQVELDFRRQAETMTALYETTRDLVMERDLSRLLRTIVERAARLVGAEAGGLFLCEPEKEQVRCVVSYNTPQDFVGAVLKYGQGAAGRVAQTGEPLIITDYRTWEGRAEIYEELQPFTAVLSVPMKWQDEMIGVIHVLGYDHERRFTPDDLQLVSAFANQAAIAMQNGRLVARLQEELAQRRQAEESLQRSEQVLELFVEHAPAAIAMLDRNMVYLAASRRYLTDYRLGEPNLKGRSHYEIFPEIPERLKEIHRRCLAGAIESCEEDPFPRADGTLDWVRWELRPWHEHSGEIGGIILFSEVITERKQAQDQLRESEKRYRALFDNAPIGIGLVDHRGRFLAFNEAMLRSGNYTGEDIWEIGNVEKLYADAAQRTEVLRLLRQHGKVTKYPVRFKKKDGAPYHALLTLTPLDFEEQAATLALVEDVSELTRFEEALRASEEQYHQLIEHAPYAVAVQSEGRLVYLNQASVKLLGARSAEELYGMSIFDFIHPDSRPAVLEGIRGLQAGKEAPPMERKLRRRDGNTIEIEATAYPVTYQNKPAVQTILRDITEHKRAEALQTALYQISEAANKAASLDELFPAVHAIIGQVMPARNFYIALYEARTNQISYPYFIDEVDGSAPAPPAMPGRGLTEYVLYTGQPLLCDNALFDDLIRHGEVELVGASSPIWLGAPLIVEGETIGVMTLQDYSDPKAYGESELRMLAYVSDQVAKAIERTRLHSDLQRRNRILSALQEATLVVMGQLELSEVLQVILAQAAQLMDTPHGFLYLLDPDETELVARLGSGVFDRYLGNRLKRGEGLAGKVWETGQPLAIDNYHRWMGRSTQYEETPFGAVVGAPLTAGPRRSGHVSGVLGLAHLEPDRLFGDEEVELLSRFAHLASLALDNARLYSLSQQELAERKKAEAALLESRAQLAGIVHSAMDGVITVDSDHRIVLFNVASEKIFGCLAGEAIGQPLDRFIPDRFRDIHREHVHRFGQTGVTSRSMGSLGELVGLRANGEEFPLEVSISQIEVNDQKFYTAIHRDITQRKRDEDAIRRYLARLEILQAIDRDILAAQSLEDMAQAALHRLGPLTACRHAGVVLFDFEKRESRLVAAYEQKGEPLLKETYQPTWTMSALETLKQTPVYYIPDLAALERHSPNAELLVAAGVRSFISAPLMSEGNFFGILNLAATEPAAFTAEHQEIAREVASQLAIGFQQTRLRAALQRHTGELEQRVAERTTELDAERRRVQTILDTAGEGILVTDLDWTIRYVNPALERITGYPAFEVIGQTPRLWQSGLTPDAVHEDISAALQWGRIWQGEIINRRKDGTLYDASLTITPLRDSAGQPIGIVIIHRDISRLKELDRLKSKFVSDVSHELRTPVTNLNLYLNLLERGKLEKRGEYLAILHQQAARLAQLIEDILDLSQMEVGAAQALLEPLDLNALAAPVIIAQRPSAEAKGLALNFVPQADLPGVRGAASQLMRVMTNLVANAINYTRTGHITVTTRAENDRVLVHIQDTGPGIDPEDLPHLFDRFYRGRHAVQANVPGTGLGLAIVKEIVEAHHGHVVVESQQGIGSIFIVSLPIRPGQ